MDLVVNFKLTPSQLAEAFCEMNDEQQAQLFIEAARIAASWGPATIPQWLAVGRHLGSCECATDDARELVSDIADGIRAAMARVRQHEGAAARTRSTWSIACARSTAPALARS